MSLPSHVPNQPVDSYEDDSRASSDKGTQTSFCIKSSLPEETKLDTSALEGDYLPEEVSVYARMINRVLKDVPALADRLPINPDNLDLLHVLQDGVIGTYLLNKLDPDRIDMRTVHQGIGLDTQQINENLN